MTQVSVMEVKMDTLPGLPLGFEPNQYKISIFSSKNEAVVRIEDGVRQKKFFRWDPETQSHQPEDSNSFLLNSRNLFRRTLPLIERAISHPFDTFLYIPEKIC